MIGRLRQNVPWPVRRLARLWAQRGHLLEHWGDLVRTRRALAPVRASLPQEGAKTVLVMPLGESVYGLKLLLMLALALRRKGWRVVVLAEDKAEPWTRSFAAAFGMRHVVDLLATEVTSQERALCERAAVDFLQGGLTLPAVKRWSYRSAWVGPQIVSTISREYMRGLPDLASPEIRRRMSELIPTTLERVLRSEKAVAAIKPDLGIVIEPNYAANGAVVDVAVARGVPVVHATQPWRDDALMCRRLTPRTRREHPSSLSPAALDTIAQREWTGEHEAALDAAFRMRYGGVGFLQSRNQPNTREFTRGGIVEALGFDAHRPLGVLFSHVLWDANLFYGEDLFDDYGHWFIETIRTISETEAAQWIVKLHPANAWKRAALGVVGRYNEESLIDEHLGGLPPHVRLLQPKSEISAVSLYRGADLGITVRGTPGMEMPCFGKPVMTAGTGRYSGMGFTRDAATRADYFRMLKDERTFLPLSDEETQRAKWHAYAVFLLRPWPMKSFRPEFRRRSDGSGFDQELVALPSTPDHTREYGDLDRWAVWAESDAIDYLTEEGA